MCSRRLTVPIDRVPRLWLTFAATAIIVGTATVLIGGTTAAPSDDGQIIARYLERDDNPPVEYRALRHLTARNERFHAEASVTAWTRLEAGGTFSYEVISSTGSGLIRSRVLEQALQAEADISRRGEPGRLALRPQNYDFVGVESVGADTQRLRIEPKRRDILLVKGSLLVRASDAELLRLEGRLSKNPSFWTRSVDVIWCYQRINEVRVPVRVESTAKIRIAGSSHFVMTYEYETINGRPVSPAMPLGSYRPCAGVPQN